MSSAAPDPQAPHEQARTLPQGPWLRSLRSLAMLFCGALVVAAAYSVRDGVQRLSGGHQGRLTATSVWPLVLLAGSVGILSFAVVEYVKRQSPLRSWFNRRCVSDFFFKEDFRFKEFQPQHYQELVDRARWGGAIVYAGSARQVTAQLSQAMRPLLGRLASPQLDPIVRSQIERLLRGTDCDLFPAVDRSGELDVAKDLEEHLERRLDAFQLDAAVRWHGLLRTMAASLAGVFAAMGQWAVHGAPTAVGVAAVMGVVVGGPFAWTIRDLARVLERKAEF